MKRFTNVKSGGVILTLLLLALVSGSVWGQETYQRVTSVSELEAEKSFLIVNVDDQGRCIALSNEQKKNNRGAVAVILANDKITLEQNSMACQLVLKGSSSVGWSFYDEVNGGYLYAASSSGNYLKTQSTLDDDGRADIRFEANIATITFKGTNKRNVMQYNPNNGSPLFACYGSESQKPLQLFKKVESIGNQVAAPVFAPANGTTFVDKLTVGASCSTEGATIYYTKDGAEPTTGSDKFPTEGVTLTETTTLKAIAVKDGLDNSEVVTATYTKLEPYASLKALKESGIATTEGVTCFVELKDAVVTYADSRKAYIQDETAGLYVFGSNKLKAGTKLNGLVSAKLALYFGLYELKGDGGEFDNVAVTNDVEIPVQEVTVAELNQNFARYESMRVKVVDATVTSSFNDKNGEIEQNGEKIALRAADENITADVQATVDVTGYPGLYNSTKQLNVILQEDIAVKTAGKTQATLTFDSDAYSVNVGESLTVKATTNSSASVIYSSSDKTIATVDENTGEVQAGNKAGTVTITATVTENDKYTGATATCTVNVVDPSALPEAKALVAEDKEGILHAMKNELGNTRLNAMEVYSLNGKIIDEGKADIKWYINIDNGTIQNIDGMYVVFEDANKADIKLSSKKGNSWYYKSEDGSWNTKETDGRFLGYNEQITAFRTYSSSTYPKAVAMPIVDGYIRSTTSGDYGTICLPYAVAAEDMAGAEFFCIAGKVMKDGEPQSIVLEQVTTLEAGVPYIFSATSDKLIAAYSGKAVAVAEEANGLIGSFEGQDVAEGMYLISAQNKVQLCGKGCKISGNRAYIDMNKVPEHSGEVGVNQRLISFEDATGISETMVEGGLADVYTLSGVEIRHQVNESEATQGLPQGIYIVNGKKVVVK
ncbi:chitobiase/beta-hexosaminidase C-terminal domain-containing protein [Paraprevotella clara]|jgi:glycoside hydrolase family 18|uniref:chitobiase/beta-hexosaminidase C-terminal domain-containing protein n=2 Tax=Paraprevotella clara TaxID=454154 RepID=UPI00265CA50D|nr:chitobiase/beta-hexosaminidase C-terminal domain-containing protein [Paraprevotella clara]